LQNFVWRIKELKVGEEMMFVGRELSDILVERLSNHNRAWVMDDHGRLGQSPAIKGIFFSGDGNTRVGGLPSAGNTIQKFHIKELVLVPLCFNLEMEKFVF
jgi:hypothetical protein